MKIDIVKIDFKKSFAENEIALNFADNIGNKNMSAV